jgi:hypothetical protein
MLAAHQKNLVIACPHKTFVLFKQDTIVTFPIRRYAKKIKKKGLTLTAPILPKPAQYCGAGHPVGFTWIHHCEKVTLY